MVYEIEWGECTCGKQDTSTVTVVITLHTLKITVLHATAVELIFIVRSIIYNYLDARTVCTCVLLF